MFVFIMKFISLGLKTCVDARVTKICFTQYFVPVDFVLFSQMIYPTFGPVLKLCMEQLYCHLLQNLSYQA
jgi:hypothetical protein